jgi:transcriptional regulator with XRE-family HTH domain
MQSSKPPDPVLAGVLRGLRYQNGLTQEALAFRADITVSAMSRIERGLSDPAWSSVRAVAQALGVSLSELGVAVMTAEQPATAET